MSPLDRDHTRCGEEATKSGPGERSGRGEPAMITSADRPPDQADDGRPVRCTVFHDPCTGVPLNGPDQRPLQRSALRPSPQLRDPRPHGAVDDPRHACGEYMLPRLVRRSFASHSSKVIGAMRASSDTVRADDGEKYVMPYVGPDLGGRQVPGRGIEVRHRRPGRLPRGSSGPRLRRRRRGRHRDRLR